MNIRKLGPLLLYRAPGVFWFRFFGRGLHFRDTAQHPLRFSERNGIQRMWTIKKLGVGGKRW